MGCIPGELQQKVSYWSFTPFMHKVKFKIEFHWYPFSFSSLNIAVGVTVLIVEHVKQILEPKLSNEEENSITQ